MGSVSLSGAGSRGERGAYILFDGVEWCCVVIFQNLYLAAPINRFIFFNLGKRLENKAARGNIDLFIMLGLKYLLLGGTIHLFG